MKILIVLQLTHQVFVSSIDCLTFGNNPFEGEDDDYIIAQVMVHKKDATTKPIGLKGDSLVLNQEGKGKKWGSIYVL